MYNAVPDILIHPCHITWKYIECSQHLSDVLDPNYLFFRFACYDSINGKWYMWSHVSWCAVSHKIYLFSQHLFALRKYIYYQLSLINVKLVFPFHFYSLPLPNCPSMSIFFGMLLLSVLEIIAVIMYINYEYCLLSLVILIRILNFELE